MATTHAPTVRETESLNHEYAYWQLVYQETVLRSGGKKAIAKVEAVLAEIRAERADTEPQA